jgi:hypothetical protein
MTRAPTARHLKSLRGVLKAAGNRDNFDRWVKMAEQRQPPGRDSIDDQSFVDRCALECYRAERDGVKPTTALRQFFERLYRQCEGVKPGTFRAMFGKSPAAATVRMKRILREKGISKDSQQSILWLLRSQPPLKKPKRKKRSLWR